MEINPTDKNAVMAFLTACQGFIRGTWSAKRGATIVRTNQKGESRTDKVFDIVVPSGQLNGQPEVGRVVLVSKAKGEVKPFVLLEALGTTQDNQGVQLTVWRGEAVGN
jgi:hypothetical protein